VEKLETSTTTEWRWCAKSQRAVVCNLVLDAQASSNTWNLAGDGRWRIIGLIGEDCALGVWGEAWESLITA